MRGILLGLTLMTAASPAWAQTSIQQWFEFCAGVESGENLSQEAQINYCNSLIASGRLTPQELAQAFVIRGGDYGIMGFNDKEVADYRTALSIDPRNSGATLGLIVLGEDPSH